MTDPHQWAEKGLTSEPADPPVDVNSPQLQGIFCVGKTTFDLERS
jgi:hypothetical protein